MAELRIVGGNVEIYDGSELKPVLTLDRGEAAKALLSFSELQRLTKEERASYRSLGKGFGRRKAADKWDDDRAALRAALDRLAEMETIEP